MLVNCKVETRKRFLELRETVASGDTHPHKKIKYVCVVEAHESTRKRLESTLPKNDDGHIAEKGFNSLIHYNLVHKFIPVKKRMREAREDPCVANGKSEEQKKMLFLKRKKKRKGKSTLLHRWTFVISRTPR